MSVTGQGSNEQMHSAEPDRPPSSSSPTTRGKSGSRAELRRLLALGTELLAATDRKSAGAALVECAVALYGFPRALVVAQQQHLAVLATHGMPTSRQAGPPESAALSAAFDAGSTQLLRGLDPVLEPWLAHLFSPRCDLLIVAVTTHGRRGALVLQLPTLHKAAWRRAVIEPLEWAAAATGHALRTLSLMELLEQAAGTDSLTMIPNRGAFTSVLEKELVRSTRTGQPVSLVIFDLDQFKSVNDLHGHQAGDQALINVAAVLSQACRDFDTAARYGGEEFVVILPNCGPEECIAVAERLRAAVSTAQAVRTLTASAGVASFPAHADDLETLVKAADQALLMSKRTGRNRTQSAGSPELALSS